MIRCIKTNLVKLWFLDWLTMRWLVLDSSAKKCSFAQEFASGLAAPRSPSQAKCGDSNYDRTFCQHFCFQLTTKAYYFITHTPCLIHLYKKHQEQQNIKKHILRTNIYCLYFKN